MISKVRHIYRAEEQRKVSCKLEASHKVREDCFLLTSELVSHHNGVFDQKCDPASSE